jgi:hypothetical protein
MGALPDACGLAVPYPIRLAPEAARVPGIGRNRTNVVAVGVLEWGFIAFVASMTALAGLFALYVVLQIFRTPSRRSS